MMGDLEGRNRPRWLMAGVMLGAGLRQKEVLELRVKDLDLERAAITVRQRKGESNRCPVPWRLSCHVAAHHVRAYTVFEVPRTRPTSRRWRVSRSRRSDLWGR